jgi:MYXO-CTERM domain-containing protein
MVPGSTNWVIEEVSTPATASFMLLGIAAVFLRRQRRSH